MSISAKSWKTLAVTVHRASGDGRHALGEHASALLAFGGAIRDKVDGREPFRARAHAGYGLVLFMAAIAYWILQRVIMGSQVRDSLLRKAIGDDWKGTASPLLYVIGIVAASFAPYAASVIYALAAGLWLVPDKRIERVLMD